MTITASDLYKPAVEKAAQAIHEEHDVGPWDKSPAWQKIWRNDAEAAILAYLNACLEDGIAREATCEIQPVNDSGWLAATYWPDDPDNFPALILRMERKP